MENNDIYAKPKLPKYIRIPKIRIIEGGSHIFTPYIPLKFTTVSAPKGIESFQVCCGEKQVDYLQIIKETI